MDSWLFFNSEIIACVIWNRSGGRPISSLPSLRKRFESFYYQHLVFFFQFLLLLFIFILLLQMFGNSVDGRHDSYAIANWSSRVRKY